MAAFQIPRTPHTTSAGKDCTFSAFVIAAVRSALAQLAESPEA